MTTIIGISGLKGSGKDTVASMITSEVALEKDIIITHFADHLKDICSLTFGVGDRCFNDRDAKEKAVTKWGITPRAMMTGMADAIKKEFGEDFFVRVLHQNMTRGGGMPTGLIIIIPDVRYDYEVDWIYYLGGSVVHVLRDVKDVGSHSSELGVAMRYKDLAIDNGGSLGELSKKVHELVVKNYPQLI